jgi:hypothetical protein
VAQVGLHIDDTHLIGGDGSRYGAVDADGPAGRVARLADAPSAVIDTAVRPTSANGIETDTASRTRLSSLGPQDKTGLVTTALPIESVCAFFPLPDLLGSKHPKDFRVGHCNTTPIGFAPHKLT